jgi:DMSO reductase family type II enzyme heme b subunit
MMNRILLFPAMLLILSACSEPADLTPLDSEGGAIIAKDVSDLPLDPEDATWGEVVIKELKLYPQHSVQPASQQTDVGTVQVQALHDGDDLALRLVWADKAPAEKRGIGQFVDGVAVEWPLKYGTDVSLPYVGMGSTGQAVALWLWHADGSTETLAAEGFGSLTTQTENQVTAKSVWKEGFWQVVIKRSLEATEDEEAGGHSLTLDPDEQGLIPLSFAIWDGEQGQRGSLKRLSAWQLIYLQDGDVDPAYIQQMASRNLVQGNAETGKKLMQEAGCIACHMFPDNPVHSTIGPDLRYVGGIHHTAYLQESLSEPSKVILAGKGFYTIKDGQRVSLMPPFMGSKQQRDDIIAYLNTLK